jgi:tetratricopeptide (TPR) repeat protein
MSTKGFVLSILVVLLLTVISTGCTNNTSETPPAKISATPVPAAVDLHKRGFDANINGNYSLALDLYDQAIVSDPKYTRAWMDKGNVLVKLNRPQEAILSYDTALSLENDLAIVWNKRGEALMMIGNYTDAKDSFENALKFAPEYVEAKENRDLAISKMK